jgi:hypothetical protein
VSLNKPRHIAVHRREHSSIQYRVTSKGEDVLNTFFEECDMVKIVLESWDFKNLFKNTDIIFYLGILLQMFRVRFHALMNISHKYTRQNM